MFGVGEWEIAYSSTIIYQRVKKLEYSKLDSNDFWSSEEVHYQPVYFIINIRTKVLFFHSEAQQSSWRGEEVGSGCILVDEYVEKYL